MSRTTPVKRNVSYFQDSQIAAAENRVMNANEITSLNAVVLHAAQISAQPPFRIERRVAEKFGVPNIKFLPASSYADAVHFVMTELSKAA